ncbi:alpha-ketoacid dehydrogenase subunit beta [Candidatus Bathyarchaeota archaeon]|jgi:pyruvate dehydrogenase E1 component beta subunit|nr:alpha-ketoacid dehydrogenase subunit beta [Candidatus Bathyarchaeota archaeon]
MPELTYAEALRQALREEMLRDPRVILMGEEIGVFEGVYKVTRGLLKEFGPERVRDTPISEAAIAGAAVGAALAGLKPVAEIMYMDFVTICLDQIATNAAKMRFMSGGKLKVPFVLRTQYSLGRMHGAQHSQFYPSIFFQVPGLKVVLPSTPHDAKGLLKASIREDNPVVFVESGALYRTKGPVPEEEYLLPLGQCDIKRKGDDITIVAVSRVVGEALTAAAKLEEQGVSAEVIDPRTIQPLDKNTIVESVKKTGRLIIASDDVKSGGIGSEISAIVVEEAFDSLDAPILRVASADMPIPFSPPLEQAYMPNAQKIMEAAKKLIG